jgi:NAD(P)-dependent dehydrogenase (short-subunit alcohol dehydrogenase family)
MIELDLGGAVALVTGGARGVGLGITQRLLDAGATVVVCGRTEPDDAPAEWIAADVREDEQVAALVEEVVRRHGRIDVVVNNAGGSPPAEAASASARFSERIVALNLLAPLQVAQHANRVMQGQERGGCIVNVASVSALRPSPGTAAYGMAKAGLVNLTRSLAVEWAPKVRVNAVAAGMVRTEQAHLHYGDEDGIASVAATVPLGRLADPTDIGDACAFLASPLASYVSGAVLEVHGGGERPAFLDAGG